MERKKIIRIVIAGIIGTIVGFTLFYWGLNYSFGKALLSSVALNGLFAVINYIAMNRFNKDNKRQ